jgi:hypothetical protein
MRVSVRAAPLLVTMLLGGCGARSALDEGGASSAGVGSSAGGGGATSTSASSAATGGGGATPACPVLVAETAIAEIASPGMVLREPALLALDAGQVTLLHDARPSPIVPHEASTLAAASFSPWTVWPPALTSSAVASNGAPLTSTLFELQFAVARTSKSPSSAFQLAVVSDPDGEALRTGSVVSGALESKGYDPVGFATTLLAFAPLSAAHVLVLLDAVSTHGDLALYAQFEFGDSPSPTFPFAGCAKAPLAADAAVSGNGWMVAAALGAPFRWDDAHDLDCSARFPDLGDPTHVYTGYVGSDGLSFVSGGAGFAEAATVARVRLAPASGGAWLSWGVAGGEAQAAIRIAKLDANAQATLGPITLPAVGGAADATTLALAAFGDDVIVADVEVADGGSGIVLHRVGPSGELVGSIVVPTNGPVDGPLTIVADPSRGILVGWSEIAADGDDRTVRVAKLVCAM